MKIDLRGFLLSAAWRHETDSLKHRAGLYPQHPFHRKTSIAFPFDLSVVVIVSYVIFMGYFLPGHNGQPAEQCLLASRDAALKL